MMTSEIINIVKDLYVKVYTFIYNTWCYVIYHILYVIYYYFSYLISKLMHVFLITYNNHYNQ